MVSLVTGGAGYIGRHLVNRLLKQGETVIVMDPKIFETLTVDDPGRMIKIDRKYRYLGDYVSAYEGVIDNVYHLAASVSVDEGERKPAEYYENNVADMVPFLNACNDLRVKNLIFLSSAAVYTDNAACDDKMPVEPSTVYGRTKVMGEELIRDIAKCNYGIIRPFNVSGLNGVPIGEAKHLIKALIQHSCAPQRDKTWYYAINPFVINGGDYATRDGTCVRDYIHIDDVVRYIDIVKNYISNGKNITTNCGTGRGYSIIEVINVVKRLVNPDLEYIKGPRRLGDCDILIADTSTQLDLGFKPKYKIDDMVRSTLSGTSTYS